MAEPLADLPAEVSAQAGQVLRKIGEVYSLYHRLILMAGPVLTARYPGEAKSWKLPN